jgi:hypothetical protein
MGLIVFRLITLGVRIGVESLKVVSVDNPSVGILNVGSTVALQGSLIKIVLVFRVGQLSCKFQSRYIILHLLTVLLLLHTLLLQLFLANLFH